MQRGRLQVKASMDAKVKSVICAALLETKEQNVEKQAKNGMSWTQISCWAPKPQTVVRRRRKKKEKTKRIRPSVRRLA